LRNSEDHCKGENRRVNGGELFKQMAAGSRKVRDYQSASHVGSARLSPAAKGSV